MGLARRGALARSAYLLTGDVHLAEDLVQDTLARVADKWRRAHANPDAYARTVMHHLAIDRWRRRTARPLEVLTDRHPETRRGRARRRRRLVLRDALARLTPEQRAVLSLRSLRGPHRRADRRGPRLLRQHRESQARTALERLRVLAPELLTSLVEEGNR